MSEVSDKLHICGHGVPIYPISQIGKLRERIDADGLDGAFVSVPTPLYRPDISAQDRRDYAFLVNDGLAEACSAHAGTLLPMAYLPAEDPELAVDIAKDLDDNWVGVSIGTDLGALACSDTRFDPLWAILAQANMPVFVHPGFSPDKRLEKFYLENLFGNPHETTLVAANMVFGGTFDRHPDLKVILAHGGGALATLAGRWQRGVETSRPNVPQDLQYPPLDAAKRFYVDTIVHNDAYLDFLIEFLGLDKILYGSDWPFPMGASCVEHALGHLSADLQYAIRTINVTQAFGERLGKCAAR